MRTVSWQKSTVLRCACLAPASFSRSAVTVAQRLLRVVGRVLDGFDALLQRFVLRTARLSIRQMRGVAVACVAMAFLFVVAGVVGDDPDPIGFGLGILFVVVFLFVPVVESAARQGRRRAELAKKIERAASNPIPDGTLVIDYLDDEGLLDVALQYEIDPGPSRVERANASKRAGSGELGLPGGSKATRASETSSEQRTYTELPRNRARLIRQVVAEMALSGELNTAIGRTPPPQDAFSVAEIRDILEEAREQGEAVAEDQPVPGHDLLKLIERVEEARIANAKEAEFSSAPQGSHVYVAGGWRVEKLIPSDEFVLSLTEPEGGQALPRSVVCRVAGPASAVSPEAVSRWRNAEAVRLAVFGRVEAVTAPRTLTIWPIAIFVPPGGSA
jgi:hypothetical protein